MKQKRYLGAVALMALVASCANEDVFQQDVNVSDLGDRPVIGSVSLELNAPAITRWSNTGFDENDVLGACLMDTWAKGEAGADAYTDVNYISTNYKFTHNNGSWVSDALFVEGNYYFYMQYNEQMRSRQALTNTIPNKQDIGEDGNASLKENQLFLGYYFVDEKATDRNIPVQMIQTYAYPKINVTYKGEKTDLKIDKIVVSSDNFVLKRTLNVTEGLTDVPTYTVTDHKGTEDSKDDESVVNVAANSKLKAYLDGFNNEKAWNPEAKVPTVVYQAVQAAMAGSGEAEDITLVPGVKASSVSGNIVVPAGDYGTEDKTLSLKIYTNKGTVSASVPYETNTVTGEDGNTTTSRKVAPYHANVDDNTENDVTLGEGEALTYEDYVSVDASKFPLSLLPSQGGKNLAIEIEFKDGAIEVPSEIAVASGTELGYYLTEWYTGRKDVETLTVTLSGDIELNSDVVAYLNNAENPAVVFTGAKKITIPANTDENIINKIKFARESNYPQIEIAAGATQKIVPTGVKASGKYTYYNPQYDGGIVNKGTLTVDRTGEFEENVASTLNANVTNEGTMTLVDVDLVGTLANSGTFTANQNTVKGAVENSGEMQAKSIVGAVTNTKNLTASTIDASASVVANDGTLTVTEFTAGNFYNMGTATVNKAKTAIFNGAKENASAQADYKAEAKLTVNEKVVGNITNYGTVDYLGSLEGTFENAIREFNQDDDEPNNDVKFAGTLNVKSNVEMTTLKNDGVVDVAVNCGLYLETLTNSDDAEITNNGILLASDFENDGTLNHKNGADTTVGTNNGTIEIEQANPTGLGVTKQSGVIEYIAKDSDFTDGKLNTLWASITKLTINASGNLDLSQLGEKVNSIVFNKKVVLTFVEEDLETDPEKPVYEQNLAELTMNEGGELATDVTINNLTLPEGKVLKILNGVTLTYEGATFTAEGTIQALGKFVAKNCEEPEDAKVFGYETWKTAQ